MGRSGPWGSRELAGSCSVSLLRKAVLKDHGRPSAPAGCQACQGNDPARAAAGTSGQWPGAGREAYARAAARDRQEGSNGQMDTASVLIKHRCNDALALDSLHDHVRLH